MKVVVRCGHPFGLLAGGFAVLVGAVGLAPSWWRYVVAVVAGPGWRWLPILLIAGGSAVLLWRVLRRWRAGGALRRHPVAERVPLFVHVTVVVLLAVGVAAAAGVGMWAFLGRPELVLADTGPAGTTAAAGWSVQNTFDAMKIVLSVVAGIGGVVALTVAYRKQDHGEAAEHRENTKLFNERFGKAADQIGAGQAAVRLAGVYAMVGPSDQLPHRLRRLAIDDHGGGRSILGVKTG